MRVLVVEDHESLARSIARGLREAGYAVDVVHRGDEGLTMAVSAPYDALILDLMLPGMGGFELLQTVRARGLDLPVLVLTARDGVADRVKGLDLGADDYLPKPFAFEELLARTRSIVRRRYGQTHSRVVIEDLEIDLTARKVRRAGLPVDLSSKEYAVLEYMGMRAGSIVSREELHTHIYDFGEETASNVLEVFISRLRRKIDARRTPKLIHTIRGRGYVLEARA